jgi:hypothetical protein
MFKIVKYLKSAKISTLFLFYGRGEYIRLFINLKGKNQSSFEIDYFF